MDARQSPKTESKENKQPLSIYNIYRGVQAANVQAQQQETAARANRRALTKQQANELYQFFLRDLTETIDKLEDEGCLHAGAARNFVQQIQATHDSFLQKFNATKIPDSELFELLDDTSKLLKTPAFNEDNTANQTYTNRVQDFSSRMNNLKSDGNWAALKGAGYTLLTALAVTAIVVTTILTVGATLPLAMKALYAVLAGGAQLALGGAAASKTIGFFNKANKNIKTANRGNELIADMQKQNGDGQVKSDIRLV